MKMKPQYPKFMECSKSSSEGQVDSNLGLPQEISKVSNKQFGLTPKRTKKEEQTKHKVSRRKDIKKDKNGNK